MQGFDTLQFHMCEIVGIRSHKVGGIIFKFLDITDRTTSQKKAIET